jgi:hypothetical protein
MRPRCLEDAEFHRNVRLALWSLVSDPRLAPSLPPRSGTLATDLPAMTQGRNEMVFTTGFDSSSLIGLPHVGKLLAQERNHRIAKMLAMFCVYLHDSERQLPCGCRRFLDAPGVNQSLRW